MANSTDGGSTKHLEHDQKRKMLGSGNKQRGRNAQKQHTLILRILHIWQPREGLPPYTMITPHPFLFTTGEERIEC